ncbi:MAG: hypothetical protein AABZ28_00105 [Nitrospinota bacterium]
MKKFEFEFSDKFYGYVNELPLNVKKRLKKVMTLLSSDPKHPSLRMEKLGGTGGIYSVRVTKGYRLTFEFREGGVIFLRVVGKHDDVYRKP